MAAKDEEPLLDVAGGDPALSRHLRGSLRLLRDKSDDPEFRRLADDILDGRQGLREASRSPVFARVLNPRVDEFSRTYDQLSDDERAELAAEGERQLAELRDRIAREKAARDAPPDPPWMADR